MKMNFVKVMSVGALTVFGFNQCAVAEEIYIAGAFGRSNLDPDAGVYVSPHYAAGQSSLHPPSISYQNWYDNEARSGSLAFGIKLNNYVNVELGYTRYGTATDTSQIEYGPYKSSSTYYAYGFNGPFREIEKKSYQFSARSVSFVLHTPTWQGLGFFGRFGFATVAEKTETILQRHQHVTGQENGSQYSDTDSSPAFLLGAGFSYEINQQFTIRTEFQVVEAKGDSSSRLYYEPLTNSSVGVIYCFN